MKLQRFFIGSLALLPVVATAGDFITYVDGARIEAKVLEVNVRDVVFKKASNPDGPVYVENKGDILRIDYENGTSDIFQELKEPRKPLNHYTRSKWEMQARVSVYSFSVSPQLDVLMGYNLNNHFRIGAGFGLGEKFYSYSIINFDKGIFEYYDDDLFIVPVFANIKYSVLTTRVTPYLQGNVGYCLAPSSYDVVVPTYHTNIAAGVEVRFKRGSVIGEMGGEFNGWRVSDHAARQKQYDRDYAYGLYFAVGYTYFLK